MCQEAPSQSSISVCYCILTCTSYRLTNTLEWRGKADLIACCQQDFGKWACNSGFSGSRVYKHIFAYHSLACFCVPSESNIHNTTLTFMYYPLSGPYLTINAGLKVCLSLARLSRELGTVWNWYVPGVVFSTEGCAVSYVRFFRWALSWQINMNTIIMCYVTPRSRVWT